MSFIISRGRKNSMELLLTFQTSNKGEKPAFSAFALNVSPFISRYLRAVFPLMQGLQKRLFPAICSRTGRSRRLYALQKEIKDTSRSGIYHNKKFKEIAESHGLNVLEADKIGWSVTSLKSETVEWLRDNCNFGEITIYKKKPLVADKEATPKQSSRKYVCPCCGLIVRATKECSIKCMECDEKMKIES